MGVFNEQTYSHPFAKGIQGAPGVGFNLTSDGNYDMSKRKLTNVGAPSDNTDAATKKYVDDNSSSSTSELTVDSNIDMKDRYRILNLKHPVDADEPATKQYSDSKFLDRDGSRTMIGNLDMNNNKIFNISAPTGPKQPIPLALGDLKYLHVGGTNKMNNNLNMNNKGIIYLKPPTSDTDAATKKYVDDNTGSPDLSPYFKKDGSVAMTGDMNMNNNRIFNLPTPTGNNQPVTRIYGNSNYVNIRGFTPMLGNLNMNNKKIYNLSNPTNNNDAATKKYVDDNVGSPDLSDYLEKDGSVAMTGNLNMNSKKIINLSNPTQDKDAVNKTYTDHLVHHTAIQPSHYNNQFSYLMSSTAQWTDETNGGNSFIVNKIDKLLPSNGNFHNYNDKVIYYTINKNSQGGYNYKMGMNFYRLQANTDYTLCLELLNTEYLLWHKSQISVDKGSSSGLTLGRVSIKKLSHRYTGSGNQTKFMYYYKLIINFRKLSSGNRFFLYVTVNIPQTGIDLNTYPSQFTGNYLVAYGIVGTFSNVDSDKVYDYHTAFDVKPTEVVYNVDVNMNSKKILNINTDESSNSAATVGMVNKLKPSIKFYIYKKFFEEFYDFSDAKCYNLVTSASGIVFNSISSISGDSARNITFPNKTIDNINNGSLTVDNYTLSFTPASKQTSYTLCLVFTIWPNRNWSLYKYDITNPNSKNRLLRLYYLISNKNLYLEVSNTQKSLTIPNSFFGKTIVLWLTENISTPITKVNFSNYSADLVINSASYSTNQRYVYLNSSTEIYRYMYSPNFYDTHNLEHHTILLEEKLLGNYVD